MDNKYHVVTHKYLGRDKYSHIYELHLTKSFVHTGRIDFMCKALDYYASVEYKGFWKSIKELISLIKYARK